MHRLRSFVVLFSFLALLSCTVSKTSYSDRVKSLQDSAASPSLTELTKILAKRSPSEADALVKTWHDWLGERTVPLMDDQNVTFVYYDFSGHVEKVQLLANFNSDKPELLTPVENSKLFYKVYQIPKPEKLRYRYQTIDAEGKALDVNDPFNRLAETGPPMLYKLPDITVTTGLKNYVDSKAEPDLAGQDLVFYLPPYYLRNLARSYSVVYVAGMNDGSWEVPVEQLILNQEIIPSIFVLLPFREGFAPSEKDLTQTLLQTVKPWVDLHYRTLSDKDNTMLIGWGTLSKTCANIVASHSDTFGKSWTPENTEDWNSKIGPILKLYFPVVAP